MGFKAKDIKGLLVLMENEKDGKALAVYGGAEWLRRRRVVAEDGGCFGRYRKRGNTGNNGGRAGQVF